MISCFRGVKKLNVGSNIVGEITLRFLLSGPYQNKPARPSKKPSNHGSKGGIKAVECEEGCRGEAFEPIGRSNYPRCAEKDPTKGLRASVKAVINLSEGSSP